MVRLWYIFVWLCRIGHCRGFGVQSPADYRFVRYVVNEHWPYYAYEDMERKHPTTDMKTRKLGRLYFRIANWLQPQTVVDYRPANSVCTDYIKAGCRKAHVAHDIGETDAVDLLRIDASVGVDAVCECANKLMGSSSVMMVEGIRRNSETKRLWKKLRQSEKVGVTFDLYYVGITFFDKKRYKQNYIVNF